MGRNEFTKVLAQAPLWDRFAETTRQSNSSTPIGVGLTFLGPLFILIYSAVVFSNDARTYTATSSTVSSYDSELQTVGSVIAFCCHGTGCIVASRYTESSCKVHTFREILHEGECRNFTLCSSALPLDGIFIVQSKAVLSSTFSETNQLKEGHWSTAATRSWAQSASTGVGGLNVLATQLGADDIFTTIISDVMPPDPSSSSLYVGRRNDTVQSANFPMPSRLSRFPTEVKMNLDCQCTYDVQTGGVSCTKSVFDAANNLRTTIRCTEFDCNEDAHVGRYVKAPVWIRNDAGALTIGGTVKSGECIQWMQPLPVDDSTNRRIASDDDSNPNDGQLRADPPGVRFFTTPATPVAPTNLPTQPTQPTAPSFTTQATDAFTTPSFTTEPTEVFTTPSFTTEPTEVFTTPSFTTEPTEVFTTPSFTTEPTEVFTTPAVETFPAAFTDTIVVPTVPPTGDTQASGSGSGSGTTSSTSTVPKNVVTPAGLLACSPGCTAEMLTDGVCQSLCFTERCNYDNGACASSACANDTVKQGNIRARYAAVQAVCGSVGNEPLCPQWCRVAWADFTLAYSQCPTFELKSTSHGGTVTIFRNTDDALAQCLRQYGCDIDACSALLPSSTVNNPFKTWGWKCDNGFKGPLCQNPRQALACNGQDCGSFGQCNQWSGKCDCDPNWTGETCETPLAGLHSVFAQTDLMFNASQSCSAVVSAMSVCTGATGLPYQICHPERVCASTATQTQSCSADCIAAWRSLSYALSRAVNTNGDSWAKTHNAGLSCSSTFGASTLAAIGNRLNAAWTGSKCDIGTGIKSVSALQPLPTPCLLDCHGRGFCALYPSVGVEVGQRCHCTVIGWTGRRCESRVEFAPVPFLKTTAQLKQLSGDGLHQEFHNDWTSFAAGSSVAESLVSVPKEEIDALFGCTISAAYDPSTDQLDYVSDSCPQCLKWYLAGGATADNSMRDFAPEFWCASSFIQGGATQQHVVRVNKLSPNKVPSFLGGLFALVSTCSTVAVFWYRHIFRFPTLPDPSSSLGASRNVRRSEARNDLLVAGERVTPTNDNETIADNGTSVADGDGDRSDNESDIENGGKPDKCVPGRTRTSTIGIEMANIGAAI